MSSSNFFIDLALFWLESKTCVLLIHLRTLFYIPSVMNQSKNLINIPLSCLLSVHFYDSFLCHLSY